MVVIILVINYY